MGKRNGTNSNRNFEHFTEQLNTLYHEFEFESRFIAYDTLRVVISLITFSFSEIIKNDDMSIKLGQFN